jgi:hypothetical protein
MKKTTKIFVVMLALTIAGCFGDNGKELFETAQLEELQNNPGHAAKLYRKIIEKYPESEYATKAREKLDRLTQSKP